VTFVLTKVVAAKPALGAQARDLAAEVLKSEEDMVQ
jgi:hypothetical protein